MIQIYMKNVYAYMWSILRKIKLPKLLWVVIYIFLGGNIYFVYAPSILVMEILLSFDCDFLRKMWLFISFTQGCFIYERWVTFYSNPVRVFFCLIIYISTYFSKELLENKKIRESH